MRERKGGGTDHFVQFRRYSPLSGFISVLSHLIVLSMEEIYLSLVGWIFLITIVASVKRSYNSVYHQRRMKAPDGL
jgi:hypothetical protein